MSYLAAELAVGLASGFVRVGGCTCISFRDLIRFLFMEFALPLLQFSNHEVSNIWFLQLQTFFFFEQS